MYCKNCGTEIKDNQKFCPKCGAKVIAEIKVKANRKKTQALIICVCCFALVVSSVIGGVVWYKKNNNPQINESDKNYVYFDSDFSDIKITDVDSALEAISAVKNELGISDVHKELKVQSVDTVDNNTFYRFQQYYNDIPVYGRSVIINAENTKSKVLTSNFTNVDKDIAINKKIEEDKIKHSIVKYFNNTNVKLSPFSEDNFCIFNFDNSKRATLAYCCQVFDDENVYTCLLDSSTAEILFVDAEMETVSAEVYSEDKKVSTIGWKNDDGSYHLYNEDYNISIFDVEGITTADENGEVKEDFRDYGIDTLYSKEGVFDKNAIILLDDIIKFNEYYKKLGDCTFDQIHGAINDEYENGNNARGGSTIVNGKNLAVILIGKNTGANDIDVIAHEYTHAVTDLIVNFTNTQNNRMPSTIDEAVSDIFGEIIESESNDKSPNWIMDSDAINLSRNISGNSGNQIYNLNDYNEKTSECHVASTIISHAAYLMWNGNGDGDIFKIDTDKLAKLWYRSLFLLQSDATFNQCANAVMLTAKSMQDTGDLTEAQVACVRRSFESVGIYPNDYLTKSSTNGANVHVKDINGNNLSSYYLKVTDEKSNVIIDSEFSDSKPYIVNVTNSGLYTFIVKQSKKSSVEYVTKVRILNINRDNSELNLQTALDLGENKKVTEDSKTNYGNVVSYNDCLYYWKYNANSFSKDECAFANYGYNEKANNQLVCRTKDGKENVILTTNGFYNIAIVNDVIYYQTADDPYHLSIKSCTINGDPLQNIDEGQLCGVIDNGKYIVYQENYDSGVHSIDTSTNALKNISNDKFLICSNDSVICTKTNQFEKLSEQEISIYKINGDGSNKEELYVNRANELDSIKSITENDYYEEGYLDISLPYIKNDNFYFIFQHIAGTGHVTQSCRSVRINLDTRVSAELKITYYEDSGALQKSSINDADYQEYIENYYNKKVLNNSDYSDFSNLELGEFGAEGSGVLMPEYYETIGDKQYILLTCGDFISWNGWRQTYEFQKCALYEKDLSSGKVIKIYDTTESNDNNDSIYQAYITQLNKACNKVKQDSKNDSTTMQFNPTYIVYDIDKNGVKELIVKTGICEADYTYEFYTYQNGLVLLGTAHAGHSGLYIPNDNNGLYLRYCPPPGDMCYVSLYRLTINKNQIKQETLYKDKEMSFDERDKFSTQYKYLEEVHASDLSFLEDL